MSTWDTCRTQIPKCDVNMSHRCRDMSSNPKSAPWLPHLIGCDGRTKSKLKNLLHQFVQLCLMILCANFRENQTKFATCENFWNFLTKSKMAENLSCAMWRHRVGWTQHEPRITRISWLYISGIRFKSYTRKCTWNFDPLVALERMDWRLVTLAN